MKRIVKIAKDLDVGVKTILNYCRILGQNNKSSNSKVDINLENQIIALHKKGINLIEIEEQFDSNVIAIQKTPVEFFQNNPFQSEQLDIISKDNVFKNRQERIIKFEETEYKTIFSDFEAYSICHGLEDRTARNIARKFFQNNETSEAEKILAHEIAMKACKKYGDKLLSFIVSFPPLPFKAVNAKKIFSEFDKLRKTYDFPILRITFNNDKNETEKLHISFYVEKRDNKIIRYDNVLMIKNKTTGQKLMRLSREGIILPEKNSKHIVPVLQVFIRFSENTKQAILNYGLETGECSICGRELTDPESIRIGIGPVCRKSISE
ncbi:MAG: DUF6011 domain-containing protein [Patescibacteria group bacterium]|nr:DUF6011 domain-containing protein [Patescibacteria group bacterium]